jgi:hypothetical protein
VFLLPPEVMGAFAPQGLLLALDKYMAQTGVTADDYYPSQMQVFQLNGSTYGLCLNPDIERVGAQLLQLGNPLVGNGQATFNDATGVQAMTFWLSFQSAGTGQLYQQLGKTWCGEAFASGQAAHFDQRPRPYRAVLAVVVLIRAARGVHPPAGAWPGRRPPASAPPAGPTRA